MATYFGGLYESCTGGYYFRFPDFIDDVVPPTARTIKGARSVASTTLRDYLEGLKEHGDFVPRPMSHASAEARLPPVLQGECRIDVLPIEPHSVAELVAAALIG